MGKGLAMKNIPFATYRMQLNHKFTFMKTAEQIKYLKALGISHLYCSPLLQAQKGSLHGYDVTDHSHLNAEIGSEVEFNYLVDLLKENGMRLILDIVPNHIFVGDVQNQWWRDVLKHGPHSHYADYFDIDWNPAKAIFKNKL